MKRILLLMLAILAFNITACNAEETKTVDWYKAPENATALEAKLAECKNNPGELADTPNCKNARAASQALFKSGSFEKVQEPEYGFGTSKSQ